MSFSSEKLTEIEQLRAQLAEKEANLQSQSERLQSQSARIAILEEVVRHLKLKRFGYSNTFKNGLEVSSYNNGSLPNYYFFI